jgi:hypothetical protein
MKRFLILAALALTSVLLVAAGCSKDSSPTSTSETLSPEAQEIRAYLEASEYALPLEFNADDQYAQVGITEEDGITLVSDEPEDGVEILPWVRFVRIGKTRPEVEYVIQIPGAEGEGTADVRITYQFTGTFVVDNTRDGIINPFYRPFEAMAIRNLVLRDTPDGWRIKKISPADVFSTNDGGTSISIASVRAWGSSHTYPEVELTSPDVLLCLNELPAFVPGDTLLVTARATSANPDGCWLFLHVHSAAYGRHPHVLHWRFPFVRDASDPALYYVRLPLPECECCDGCAGVPRIFHLAVDGIGWDTLFGDETAVYNSKMWSVPCVFAYPQLVTE